MADSAPSSPASPASFADEPPAPSPLALVKENFVPTILVFATPDADQTLKKNGDNFSILSLLSSFSSIVLPSASNLREVHLCFSFRSLLAASRPYFSRFLSLFVFKTVNGISNRAPKPARIPFSLICPSEGSPPFGALAQLSVSFLCFQLQISRT
jgi:hypothetical protein